MKTKKDLVARLVELGNQEEVVDDIISYMFTLLSMNTDVLEVLDSMGLEHEYKDILLTLYNN